MISNFSTWITNDGQRGYWFSGSKSYSESVSRVFFPAAGTRSGYDAECDSRDGIGSYWSSNPDGSYAYHIYFLDSRVAIYSSYYHSYGLSVRCVKDANSSDNSGNEEEPVIHVSSVTLSSTSLKLYEGDKAVLTADVMPMDATNPKLTWSSDAPEIVYVDQNGEITAISEGPATITATADGVSATCKVVVSSLMVATANYVDEYGVNRGPGVEIDGVVWAPVNCGYHETDYPWGKLYQWGRKYGQGYNSNDASVPSIVRGPEDFYTVQQESNSNKFYSSMNLDFDWIYGDSKSYLWNSGTEENPIKTEYDPCPDGWRVPTYIELDALKANYSSLTTSNGQNGYWFSGSKSYSESVNSIFLSAAGERLCGDGSAGGRGNYGRYWSSSPYYNDTYLLNVGRNVLDYFHRASGCSVRCVKATDEVAEL